MNVQQLFIEPQYEDIFLLDEGDIAFMKDRYHY